MKEVVAKKRPSRNLVMAGINTKMLTSINSIVVPWNRDFQRKIKSKKYIANDNLIYIHVIVRGI